MDDIVHRVLLCLEAGARDGLRDFRERSFDVFAFRANESKQLVAGALWFYSK